MDTAELTKAILNIGATGALIMLVIVVMRELKATIKDKDDKIKEKDARIKELSDAALEVIKDNTRTQTELRSSIQENTRATETLTSRIYEALKK